MISEAEYSELCRSFIPEAGDVLLAIVGATIGKVASVPDDFGQFHIQRSLAIFRASNEVNSKWLENVLRSSGFQKLLWANVGFSAQPGIYLGSLANFRVPVPPLHEQEEIIFTMLPHASKLQLMLGEAEFTISLLQERRGALISAAITGKIDVRGLLPATTAQEAA